MTRKERRGGRGFDELEKLFRKVARRRPAPGLAPIPDLGDLLPGPEPVEPEIVPSQAASGGLAPLPDLGDLEPRPARLEGPRDAPSLESRLRLDLGDLEPSPAPEELPELPERHLDLSEVSDAGGWIVVDLGEWSTPEVPPWLRKAAEPSRRGNRYGVVPVADLPEDQPVSGTMLSHKEALEVARQLNSLREVMET